MRLLTIGHSNHSLERFTQLLDQAGIQAVVDVRTVPMSRYNPQFNQANLDSALTAQGRLYFFAGKYLGGRPGDPACYKKRALPPEGADFLHEVDYPEVMRRDWFVKGVERLLEIADEQTTAVLCSEEDPAQCHRHHLIAKYLLRERPEVQVQHVRGDGQIVNAASLLASVDDPGAEQMPLF
jgi:uncharacterized protein (DUF488 family)